MNGTSKLGYVWSFENRVLEGPRTASPASPAPESVPEVVSSGAAAVDRSLTVDAIGLEEFEAGAYTGRDVDCLVVDCSDVVGATSKLVVHSQNVSEV